MSNPRSGYVTHKMVVATYTLVRLDLVTHYIERVEVTRRGNWNYNRIWQLEYTAASREHQESGKMFVDIENYSEKVYIVGIPNDEYFSQAKVIKEVKA